MKRIQKFFLAFFITYSLMFGALTVAQLNYLHALRAARQSEGSDQAIEDAMRSHGFNVDAMDTQEPSTGDKFTALFNR